MREKGTHTWELYTGYHICPNCQKIIESRQDFTLQNGKYLKEIACPRCHLHFQVEKKSRVRFGPIFGSPPSPEFDWR